MASVVTASQADSKADDYFLMAFVMDFAMADAMVAVMSVAIPAAMAIGKVVLMAAV